MAKSAGTDVIIQVIADVKPWKDGLKKVQESTKDTAKKVQESVVEQSQATESKVDQWTKRIVALGKAALIAFAVKALKDTISAGIEWIRVEENLARNAKRFANATKEQIDMLSKLADKIQENGVIAGDTLKKGQAELFKWGLTVEQVADSTEILADVLAQLGEAGESIDIKSLTDMIGRATKTGNLRSLFQYVKSLSEADAETFKNMKSSERFLFILKKLKEEYGGFNKEIGESAYGNLQKLKNQWEDILKQLGAGLLPLLGIIVKALTPVLQILQKIIDVVTTISNYVNNSWFGKALKWIWNNLLLLGRLGIESPIGSPQSSPQMMQSPGNLNNKININLESRNDNWGGEYATVKSYNLGTQLNSNYGREIF